MDSDARKYIAFALIFVFGILGAALALKLQTSHRVLSLAITFGGGVFIGAGFIHLLGDASGSLDNTDGYPYAMLWASLGVLATLIAEEIALAAPLEEEMEMVDDDPEVQLLRLEAEEQSENQIRQALQSNGKKPKGQQSKQRGGKQQQQQKKKPQQQQPKGTTKQQNSSSSPKNGGASSKAPLAGGNQKKGKSNKGKGNPGRKGSKKGGGGGAR